MKSSTFSALACTAAVVAAAALGACAPAPSVGDPQGLLGPITEAERSAYLEARPVLDRHCGACHDSSGHLANSRSLGVLSIDDYPFGGIHAARAGERFRLVLGAAGRPPTMPLGQPGAVAGDELALILRWADAFDAARAAAAEAAAAEAAAAEARPDVDPSGR